MTRPPRAALRGACTAAAALCAVVAHAADPSPVQVHGFIGLGYVLTDENGYYDPDTSDGGSIDFHEVAINLVCRPEERLRLGVQIISQDMGRLYNNELSIDWANAVYTLPVAGWEADLKFGRIRTGHALYNDFRDIDLSRTSVFLPESVYYNGWRRLYLALDGVGLELRSPATRAGSFKFGAVYGNQQVPDDDPMLEAYAETVDASDLERQWGVQATWMPVEGLTLKQSFLQIEDWDTVFAPADPDAPGALLQDRSPLYQESVTSVELLAGAWSFASEVITWTSAGTSDYTGATPGSIDHDDWEQSGVGGYATVGWEAGERWRVQAMAQAHNFRSSGSYGGGYASSDQTRSIGAAASWSITAHWLLKAELQRVKGTYFLRSSDQPEPGDSSEHWSLFALKTSFDF